MEPPAKQLTKPAQIQGNEQTPCITLRRLLWVGPLAMAGATVANLALYAVAGSLFPSVTAWASE